MLPVLLGVALFATLLLLFLLIMSRSSAQSVLLDRVAREARQNVELPGSQAWHGLINVELLAKPFAAYLLPSRTRILYVDFRLQVTGRHFRPTYSLEQD